jgi:hypothetical protein
VAIHWDYAREVLQKADGVLATVGLEADLSALDEPTPSGNPPMSGPAHATDTAAAGGGPDVAPGAATPPPAVPANSAPGATAQASTGNPAP